MAITWLTQTFKCTNGSMSDQGGSYTDWTNPTYAWDDNDSNLASCAFSGFGVSENLIGSSISVSGYSGKISRVWVGVKVKSSNLNISYFLIGYDNLITPTIYGGISSFFKNTIINTEETFWGEVCKVDNDMNAITDEITWTDVANLNCQLTCMSSGAYTAYCNQMYVKVEYTTQDVTRGNATIHYNTGSTLSSGVWNDTDWTNSANAWDNNDSNYATVAITSPNYSYLLRATGHDNAITAGEIKLVIASVSFKSSATGDYRLVVGLSINNGSSWIDLEGAIDGGTYGSISTTEAERVHAIIEGVTTLDADDFSSWTVFNNTDMRCGFGYESTAGTISVNQFELQVVYYNSVKYPRHGFVNFNNPGVS